MHVDAYICNDKIYYSYLCIVIACIGLGAKIVIMLLASCIIFSICCFAIGKVSLKYCLKSGDVQSSF